MCDIKHSMIFRDSFLFFSVAGLVKTETVSQEMQGKNHQGHRGDSAKEHPSAPGTQPKHDDKNHPASTPAAHAPAAKPKG